MIERPDCAGHPGRAAIAACADCKAPLCEACALDDERAQVCERCLHDRYERRAATAAAPAARAERRRSSVLLAGIFVAVIAAIGGAAVAVYFAALPSIALAKGKARGRQCAVSFTRIYDAASLYADDNGGVLPRPADGRVETLVRDLVRTGYLREPPARLCPGEVAPVERKTNDGPVPYIYDDAARHDGKRNVVDANRMLDELTDADLEKALKKP